MEYLNDCNDSIKLFVVALKVFPTILWQLKTVGHDKNKNYTANKFHCQLFDCHKI